MLLFGCLVVFSYSQCLAFGNMWHKSILSVAILFIEKQLNFPIKKGWNRFFTRAKFRDCAAIEQQLTFPPWTCEYYELHCYFIRRERERCCSPFFQTIILVQVAWFFSLKVHTVLGLNQHPYEHIESKLAIIEWTWTKYFRMNSCKNFRFSMKNLYKINFCKNNKHEKY